MVPVPVTVFTHVELAFALIEELEHQENGQRSFGILYPGSRDPNCLLAFFLRSLKLNEMT